MCVEKYRLQRVVDIRLGCETHAVAFHRPDEAVHHLVVERVHPTGRDGGEEVVLEERVEVAGRRRSKVTLAGLALGGVLPEPHLTVLLDALALRLVHRGGLIRFVEIGQTIDGLVLAARR